MWMQIKSVKFVIEVIYKLLLSCWKKAIRQQIWNISEQITHQLTAKHFFAYDFKIKLVDKSFELFKVHSRSRCLSATFYVHQMSTVSFSQPVANVQHRRCDSADSDRHTPVTLNSIRQFISFSKRRESIACNEKSAPTCYHSKRLEFQLFFFYFPSISASLCSKRHFIDTFYTNKIIKYCLSPASNVERVFVENTYWKSAFQRLTSVSKCFGIENVKTWLNWFHLSFTGTGGRTEKKSTHDSASNLFWILIASRVQVFDEN